MGGIYYVAAAGQYNGLFGMMVSGTASIPVTNTTVQGIMNGTITSLSGSAFVSQPYNFYGDLSMLFYLVNAVLIGYMAGALSGGSTNFNEC